MDPIQSHQELLISLAGNGDPTAFYTLISQYANAAYIAERNSGKNHKESLSILIPFIKTAYQDFIKTSPHKTFDVWYREYKKKYFEDATTASASENSSDLVDIEKIPMTDIAHFDRILDLILQRKYGKIKRTLKSRWAFQFRRLHPLIKTGIIVFIIGMLFIAFHSYLAISKRQFSISLSSSGSFLTVTMPFSLKKSFHKTEFSGKNIFDIDSTIMHVQTIHDTIMLHDTIRTLPRLNSAQQQKKPIALPLGMGTQTAPIQPIKPPASTGTIVAPPSVPATPKTAGDSLLQK
jgi:hypothetical protein